jgi:hypothetical protein
LGLLALGFAFPGNADLPIGAAVTLQLGVSQSNQKTVVILSAAKDLNP